MKKNIYISTPLYYVNAKPHLGHLFTTVLADVYKRFQENQQHSCFLLTGTDEHGKKILESAKKNNTPVEEFVLNNREHFLQLWKLAMISFSFFQKTTNRDHESLVKNVFKNLHAKNEIYSGKYNGYYCVSCEEFYSEYLFKKQNSCSICNNKLIYFEENAYFLKIKNQKKWITNIYDQKIIDLYPEEIKKEMFSNFIDNDLTDLCISRKKNNWGIENPLDDKQEIYVWFDALLGYLNFPNLVSYKNSSWCKADYIVQFIGKEITRFHSLYWPVILEKNNFKLPNKIISHGWITMKDGKMSKSKGNVVDPVGLIQKYGVDQVRFFLTSEISIVTGGKYSEDLLIASINTNLVNNLGNLLSRVTQMIIKYNESFIPESDENSAMVKKFKQKLIETKTDYERFWNDFDFISGINKLMDFGKYMNFLIEETKPWKLYEKKEKKPLFEILNCLVNGILFLGFSLNPILVKSWAIIKSELGVEDSQIRNFKNFNKIKNSKVKKTKILFQRII